MRSVTEWSDRLTISVRNFDSYIAELEVHASAAGFAGAMWTYSWDADQLRRFASTARQYPLSPKDRPTLAFGDLDESGRIVNETLRVEVRPVGVRGQGVNSAVSFTGAAPTADGDNRPRDLQQHQRVHANDRVTASPPFAAGWLCSVLWHLPAHHYISSSERVLDDVFPSLRWGIRAPR